MKNRKMWFLVKCICLYLVCFSEACMLLAFKTHYEPETLIQMTFTVFGVELAAMMIKKILDNWKE